MAGKFLFRYLTLIVFNSKKIFFIAALIIDVSLLIQASRGGIIVETERSEKKATSRLTLADVKAEDSGNYTCKPGNAKSHSVNLVVVEGD